MNKRGDENRSVRNTKKKLRDGLLTLMKDKPINEITAKELTESVDVNRGTFYFHYSDVYSLLGSIEDDFFAHFDQALNEMSPADCNAQSHLAQIFSFMGENQDLCRIMLGRNGDMIFVERVKRLVEDKCARFWRMMVPNTGSAQIELYNAFVVNGCIGIVKKWLDNGLKEKPEEISRLVATIVINSVERCIG